MLPNHLLATAIQAEREREIRERVPRPVEAPTAHRRPAIALSATLPNRGSDSQGALSRPRVGPARQG